jgi:anti-sigma regulatory factor (Ser/Thr protein kinase)
MHSGQHTIIDAPLPRTADCGSVARQLLRQHLRPRVSVALFDDATIVTSELVNNAFLHGRGQIDLRVSEAPDGIRVEVIDEGRNAGIAVCDHRKFAQGGHGLKLVEQVAATWGAHEGTTHVWAELKL